MFKPFETTGIGSLPHKDPEEACRLIFDTFDIPFWPQLPNLSFHESMIVQFSEDMPSIRIEEKKEKIWVEKERSDELMDFYNKYSEEWVSPISEGYAKGIYTFMRILKDKKTSFLKGQVTGPLTFSLGLKDSDGKPVFFNEELREISLMLLKSKVRWQVEVLKPFAENIIIFIDEPILSALGSTSYIGVNSEETLRLLKEISDAIRYSGAIPGIHCCGNADWQLVIKSRVNIISFDAYGYIDTISLYPLEFTDFLKDGGYLAWGIIPTTDSLKEENVDSLKKRFQEGVKKLSKFIPEDLLLSQIFLTPSCGTGSRSIEETLKIFHLIKIFKRSVSE
ncbi:MAG: hypothetical protein HXY47_08440 [Nitrospirae bacterium]|nr:hypothetical protein [Nitrospirota bacterium]